MVYAGVGSLIPVNGDEDMECSLFMTYEAYASDITKLDFDRGFTLEERLQSCWSW